MDDMTIRQEKTTRKDDNKRRHKDEKQGRHWKATRTNDKVPRYGNTTMKGHKERYQGKSTIMLYRS